MRDFLTDTAIYPNIVCNPPFETAVQLIQHGLKHVIKGGRVAVLAPLRSLASQERHTLFKEQRPLVLIFSRRPSLPPGKMLLANGERIRRNGSDDFFGSCSARSEGRIRPHRLVAATSMPSGF